MGLPGGLQGGQLRPANSPSTGRRHQKPSRENNQKTKRKETEIPRSEKQDKSWTSKMNTSRVISQADKADHLSVQVKTKDKHNPDTNCQKAKSKSSSILISMFLFLFIFSRVF